MSLQCVLVAASKAHEGAQPYSLSLASKFVNSRTDFSPGFLAPALVAFFQVFDRPDPSGRFIQLY
jgi:hypothetical protein